MKTYTHVLYNKYYESIVEAIDVRYRPIQFLNQEILKKN